jgi:hypothetical protein
VGLSILALLPVSTRAELTDGLVAYYNFDDGGGDILNESTGLSEDGELFGFPGDNSQWVAGRIGGALEFDGVDDHVIASAYPLAETALSVSIWGWADQGPTWGTLVKNWGGAQVGQFHFGLGQGAADTLNIFITDSTGSAFNAGTDTDPIEFGQWEHYAFVANPDEMTVKLFRNGEVVDEQPYDGTFTDTPNSEALGIGVKTNDSGDGPDPGNPGYWDGKMDDLGIWLRALTDDEIKGIYDNGLLGLPIAGGSLPGDFNGNGALDAPDIDDLTFQSASGTHNPKYDLNADTLVNEGDINVWVKNLFGGWIGDANLDREFTSTDLVEVLAAGRYEAGTEARWSTGDFTGDGLANSSDLVAALADGGYESGPPNPPAAVPEPSSALLLTLALVALCRRSRMRPACGN